MGSVSYVEDSHHGLAMATMFFVSAFTLDTTYPSNNWFDKLSSNTDEYQRRCVG